MAAAGSLVEMLPSVFATIGWNAFNEFLARESNFFLFGVLGDRTVAGIQHNLSDVVGAIARICIWAIRPLQFILQQSLIAGQSHLRDRRTSAVFIRPFWIHPLRIRPFNVLTTARSAVFIRSFHIQPFENGAKRRFHSSHLHSTF